VSALLRLPLKIKTLPTEKHVLKRCMAATVAARAASHVQVNPAGDLTYTVTSATPQDDSFKYQVTGGAIMLKHNCNFIGCLDEGRLSWLHVQHADLHASADCIPWACYLLSLLLACGLCL
jgi:hypothetical protein